MSSHPEEDPRQRGGAHRGANRHVFPAPAMTIWMVVAAITLLTTGTMMWSKGGPGSGTATSNSHTPTVGGFAAPRPTAVGAPTSGSSPSSAPAGAPLTALTSEPLSSSSSTGVASGSAPGAPSTVPAAGGLSTAELDLGTEYSYLTPGYGDVPQWQRIDTAAAPDGHLLVAWQGTDGVHVTPLARSGQRTGSDTVVSGAQEVSGLVAFDDGFALLTRRQDADKWNETAAYLVRYKGSTQAWAAKLTDAASHDTAPVLGGVLRWDGSRFGAYFTVHGAGGPTDGHYGDKLVYVDAAGNQVPGGWNWGCSRNEGTALWPVPSGPFASLCGDDWRSGIFVSTGIGAPDDAPVIERQQCWAGYCGGVLGGLVGSQSGRYAAVFTSRGDASAARNPLDPTGRGWTVTSKWATHQVAVSFLGDPSTPSGPPVYLTTDIADDHVDARIAPYGDNDYLVSWETITNPVCAAGTCTGTYEGTHLRVIDSGGRFITDDLVVQAPVAGDIAVLPDGSLAWAGPNGPASAGVGAATSVLTVAILHP